MSKHELVAVATFQPALERDRARVALGCPGCDLTVQFTIAPASRADHFSAAVTEAHRNQMAPAGEAGGR